MLGFRVPTTSGGKGCGAKGVKGSEAYSILGFMVSTTSVGARGEGVEGAKAGKGSEWGQRGPRAGLGPWAGLRRASGRPRAKGSEGSEPPAFTA